MRDKQRPPVLTAAAGVVRGTYRTGLPILGRHGLPLSCSATHSNGLKWRSPSGRAWAEFIPFLDYDVQIRTVICPTNAIESINARYRRAIKGRGTSPTSWPR